MTVFYSEDWESHPDDTLVSSISGWTTGSADIKVRTSSGNKVAGVVTTAGGANHWMERTANDSGILYYTARGNGVSSAVALIVNSVTIFTNSGNFGAARRAYEIQSGDVIRFSFGAGGGQAANVDDIDIISAPTGKMTHLWSPTINSSDTTPNEDLVSKAHLVNSGTVINRVSNTDIGGLWAYDQSAVSTNYMFTDAVINSKFRDTTAKFSASIWGYRSNTSNRTIFGQRSTTGTDHLWYIGSSGSNLFFDVSIFNSGLGDFYTSKWQYSSLPTWSNTWKHIAISFDGSLSGSSRAKMWLDGSPLSPTYSTTNGTGYLGTSAVRTYVGYGSTASRFVGLVDTAILFADYLLTDDDATELASTRGSTISSNGIMPILIQQYRWG